MKLSTSHLKMEEEMAKRANEVAHEFLTSKALKIFVQP